MRTKLALQLRPSTLALSSWSDNIPSDISSDDDSFGRAAQMVLLPNTEIAPLDSAFSVGVFLWCMLYYILAKDTILSGLAIVMKYNESTFYKDYKDNYAYDVPFDVEVVRVLVIGLLATATTSVTSVVLEDLYWGWAISGSLLIPSVLFYLAQEKRPSRAEGELVQEMLEDFAMFRDENIVYKKGSVMDIDRVVMLFRRRHLKYRDDSIITDRAIKKAARRSLGKAKDGIYADLELVSRMRDSKKLLAENIARARERAVIAASATGGEEAAEALPETEGTEFMRSP